MRRFMMTLVLVAVAGVMAVSNANAGWVVSEKSGEEIMISKGKMRTNWDNGAAIFDGNTKMIHFFDDARKMKASGTVEEICTGMTKLVESMMANIPEEQREMMKKMMGDAKMPEVTIVEKGKGEKLSGFDTMKYDVMADGELYEEVWLTDDKTLMKDCEAVMKMMMEFSKCMSSIQAMSGDVSVEGSPEYMTLIEKGMMVKTVRHGESSSAGGVDITGVVKQELPDEMFLLPAGYKDVPFSEVFGMGMSG